MRLLGRDSEGDFELMPTGGSYRITRSDGKWLELSLSIAGFWPGIGDIMVKPLEQGLALAETLGRALGTENEN